MIEVRNRPAPDVGTESKRTPQLDRFEAAAVTQVKESVVVIKHGNSTTSRVAECEAIAVTEVGTDGPHADDQERCEPADNWPVLR